MKLIFEASKPGRGTALLPPCDVPYLKVPEYLARKKPPRLPEMAECDLSRHYSALSRQVHGVNDGFYPLGSCTMKYNPKINEEIASLPGFQQIHPLQPDYTVKGCREVLSLAGKFLCEITGMDDMTFQPAAGAHGEFTGLLIIKAYHLSRGDSQRTTIIIPDSAHGTNPASASMAGFRVVSLPSRKDGCVDLEQLRKAADKNTAGFMLTNPNTAGLFEKDILKIAEIVHNAGGLMYYDGANLNGIMGIARPGDMGFDVVHLNLHKTFSAPHGGGGPGSGPVGCKAYLAQFLPQSKIRGMVNPQSIGQVRAFYGNFLVIVKALAYILTLGAEGIRETAENAVLNANYMMNRLSDLYDIAFDSRCMHEFVITLQRLKKEKNVSAMDMAKSLLDWGIHPPTMYFPLIVHEALMFEPTETESKEMLDAVVEILRKLYAQALTEPESLHQAPMTTPVRRVDEVGAARKPRLKYEF